MKKQTKKQEKYMPYLIIGGTFFGFVIGSLLISLFEGEFRYDGLIGGGLSCLILTIIVVIKRKRKNNNIPEVDERVKNNTIRFFFYVSQIFLGILFLSLGLISLTGEDSIRLIYLWIFFFSYIAVAGIGSLIVRKV
jgi:hypothetical protein